MATDPPPPGAPRIHDISPVISPRSAVFPGDTPFSRDVLLSIDAGSHLDLSTIHTTVHVGAHTDAPSHYAAHAHSIEQRGLWRYYGPCQVVHTGPTALVTCDHIAQVQAPRVLFATGTFPDPNHWTDGFAALDPELVHHLHRQGVHLVGIDTPSIDPATSQTLDAHAAVASHDMAILEGIVLQGIPEGLYTLSALPLRIEGADASPVRAVLIDNLRDLTRPAGGPLPG